MSIEKALVDTRKIKTDFNSIKYVKLAKFETDFTYLNKKIWKTKKDSCVVDFFRLQKDNIYQLGFIYKIDKRSKTYTIILLNYVFNTPDLKYWNLLDLSIEKSKILGNELSCKMEMVDIDNHTDFIKIKYIQKDEVFCLSGQDSHITLEHVLFE